MTTISSIPGYGGQQPPPPQPLSADQQSLVKDTLSAFDSESLTEEDAKAIVSAFKDAGIRPSKELAGLASELGFDLKEVGDKAGVEGPGGRPPPPPPQDANLNTEGLQELQSIIDDYDLADLSEDEEEEILSAFEEAGLVGEEGSLFSLTV